MERYPLGLGPYSGEKPPNLSKLSCSSGLEPQCPGSRAFVLVSAYLETRDGVGQCPGLVPQHSDSFHRKEKKKVISLFPLHALAGCFVAVRMCDRQQFDSLDVKRDGEELPRNK